MAVKGESVPQIVVDLTIGLEVGAAKNVRRAYGIGEEEGALKEAGRRSAIDERLTTFVSPLAEHKVPQHVAVEIVTRGGAFLSRVERAGENVDPDVICDVTDNGLVRPVVDALSNGDSLHLMLGQVWRTSDPRIILHRGHQPGIQVIAGPVGKLAQALGVSAEEYLAPFAAHSVTPGTV